MRISEYLKASAFGFSGSDERLRRYTFKGYTIVARDVNRRQLVSFGWQKITQNNHYWLLIIGNTHNIT